MVWGYDSEGELTKKKKKKFVFMKQVRKMELGSPSFVFNL